MPDNNIEHIKSREEQQLPIRTLQDDPANPDIDNSLLSSLNMRMKGADWSKYTRGSEAFFDIDHDLENLAKQAPDKAAELWEINAPRGMEKPFYLNERTLDSSPSQQYENADIGDSNSPDDEQGRVPAGLRKRFVVAGNKFHFRDTNSTLAFQDNGKTIGTQLNDPGVAASMVELAEAKGWTKLHATGTEDFKREIWLQASLKGMEVTGYKPKDVDLARLEEMRGPTKQNEIKQDVGREKAGRDSVDFSGVVSKLSGKLLEHGSANYDFDKKNDKSYYVKLETAAGTKTHWGVDLERAMTESKTKVGDRIEIEGLGKQPVTVPVKQYDGSGKVIGVKDEEVFRNTWQVNKEGEIKKAKAPPLKGNDKVVASVMADVLKEKGYSANTISKAVQETTKRLEAMKEAGKKPPTVQMYDKSASRSAKREPVISQTKDKERTVGGR